MEIFTFVLTASVLFVCAGVVALMTYNDGHKRLATVFGIPALLGCVCVAVYSVLVVCIDAAIGIGLFCLAQSRFSTK